MSRTPIPEQELLDVFDVTTIWVASPKAPKDCWTLREAVVWAMAHPARDRITLFRPPSAERGAAWIKPEQLQRLADHPQP